MAMSSLGTRILGGALGGVLGFCVGPVTGSMLGSILSGQSGGPAAGEAGRFCGMAAGLIGGAALGAYLAGHPLVAKWALGLGAAVGGITFLAGFAGPIILTPDSPQGPLLGIFITGPLGFIVGTVVGLVVGISRQRSEVKIQ